MIVRGRLSSRSPPIQSGSQPASQQWVKRQIRQFCALLPASSRVPGPCIVGREVASALPAHVPFARLPDGAGPVWGIQGCRALGAAARERGAAQADRPGPLPAGGPAVALGAAPAGTGAPRWPRLARFAFRPALPAGVLARDVDLVAGLLRDSDRHGDLPRLPNPARALSRMAAQPPAMSAVRLHPPCRRRPGAIRRSQSASGAALEFCEGRDILEVRSAMPTDSFQIQGAERCCISREVRGSEGAKHYRCPGADLAAERI